ncbi:MAG TPA: LapA family protein [Thermomicrobiales bacterium]|nr:LapA family protein [Thermomicrobiales bacterium]
MNRQPTVTPPEPRSRWTTVRYVISAIVIVLLIVFIVDNYNDVEVHFVFWTATIQLAWALVIAALLGLVAGWLLRHMWRRR